MEQLLKVSVIVLIAFSIFGATPQFADAADGGASAPELMISTSPSGPIYPAATWIRVACKYNSSHPHLLRYRWTGRCNSTNTAVFDIGDPFFDEQGWAVIWVKSTPVNCLDYFRCTVQKTIRNTLTELASEIFTLEHVSGVGISLPDSIFLGSIPNNSAVVFQEGLPQEVVCHSASKTACGAGHWTSTAAETDTQGCESTAEVTFNSVTLDLSEVSTQTLHTCVVNDEMGEQQKLFIGVYQTVPTALTMEQSFHTTTDSQMVLECDTRGLPSTAALWSKDGVLLTSDDVSFMHTELLSDNSSAHYRNSLTIPQDMLGIVSCNIYSDWVTTDKRNWGRIGANGFFMIASLSERVNLECSFPDGVTHVEWLNGSTPLMADSQSTGRNNTATISLTVTEEIHGETYMCTGRDSQGRQLEQHYMILAQIPTSSLSMGIKPIETQPAIGQQVQLVCYARHSNSGISLSPMLQWFKDGQLLATKIDHWTSEFGGQGNYLAVTLEHLTLQDEGEYTCRANLHTPSHKELLVKQKSFELTLQQQSTTMAEGTATEELDSPGEKTTTLCISLTFVALFVATLILSIAVCIKAYASCRKAATQTKQDTGIKLEVGGASPSADVEKIDIEADIKL